MRYYISDLKNYVGKTVELKGWAYNTRSSGKVKFLELRDGTGIVSCVYYKGSEPGQCSEEAWNLFEQVTQESTVKVTGVVKQHPKNPNVFEIGAEALEVLHRTVDYPITPKDHGIDFLMDNRHLWLRSKRQTAILHVRHEIVKAVRDFFDWPRVYTHRRADFHAERVRRHVDTFRNSILRRKGLSLAVGSALHGGHGRSTRKSLLLWSDFPR